VNPEHVCTSALLHRILIKPGLTENLSLFQTNLFDQFLTIKKTSWPLKPRVWATKYFSITQCFNLKKCAWNNRLLVVMMKSIWHANLNDRGKLEWASVKPRRSAAASYAQCPALAECNANARSEATSSSLQASTGRHEKQHEWAGTQFVRFEFFISRSHVNKYNTNLLNALHLSPNYEPLKSMLFHRRDACYKQIYVTRRIPIPELILHKFTVVVYHLHFALQSEHITNCPFPERGAPPSWFESCVMYLWIVK
jgi:hypothetical protein